MCTLPDNQFNNNKKIQPDSLFYLKLFWCNRETLPKKRYQDLKMLLPDWPVQSKVHHYRVKKCPCTFDSKKIIVCNS